MALLGQGFRPELGVYDYSGITRANEMMGQATAQLGQKIGAGVEDYFKAQADDKKKVKAGDAQIAAAMALFPDQKLYLEQIQHSLKDENNSISERAAIASSVSDMINMGVNQMRYGGEMLMKQRELATSERAANDAHNASSYLLGVSQKKEEANSIVNGSIGPAKLQAAINMAKRVRPEILSGMPDISTMAPDIQNQIADSITQLLPEKEQMELVKDYPVTVAGKTGTMPVMVGKNSGEAFPVSLVPQGGADGSLLPPRDLVDANGVIIPANEAELVADNSDSQVFRYLGNDYVVPKEAPSLPNGFTPTESKMSPTEQVAVARYADEKAAKTGDAEATVAKSGEMLSALTKLEAHPGFNNLFGSNVGTPTWIPGTSGADAKALFNQIEGKGFIEAIQAMKGMGALSNAEGEKASMSYLGLTPAMSEDAAKARIKELKSLVEQGINRQKSGKLVNPDGTPKSASVQNTPGSSDLLNAWQNRPR